MVEALWGGPGGGGSSRPYPPVSTPLARGIRPDPAAGGVPPHPPHLVFQLGGDLRVRLPSVAPSLKEANGTGTAYPNGAGEAKHQQLLLHRDPDSEGLPQCVSADSYFKCRTHADGCMVALIFNDPDRAIAPWRCHEGIRGESCRLGQPGTPAGPPTFRGSHLPRSDWFLLGWRPGRGNTLEARSPTMHPPMAVIRVRRVHWMPSRS
jgi:hypothetical protein